MNATFWPRNSTPRRREQRRQIVAIFADPELLRS